VPWRHDVLHGGTVKKEPFRTELMSRSVSTKAQRFNYQTTAWTVCIGTVEHISKLTRKYDLFLPSCGSMDTREGVLCVWKCQSVTRPNIQEVTDVKPYFGYTHRRTGRKIYINLKYIFSLGIRDGIYQ